MKILTSPSVLACDFLHLEDEIRRADAAGSDWLHCDVMDGMFVPNMSFGFDTIRAIDTVSDLPLDVHMMTCVPQNYLDALKNAGADIVTIHNDIGLSDEELHEVLKNIHARGMKAAMSLKPKFPAETVFPFLEELDMVLIMTVEPGFGGQSFMADQLPKIRAIANAIEAGGYACELEVDGGIDKDTAPLAIEAGANVLVAGSSVFKANDRSSAMALLR